MWTVDAIRTKVEELEANGVESDESVESVEDGAETEDSETYEQLKQFLNLIDDEQMIDDSIADAILGFYKYDADQLDLASRVIRIGDYSLYVSVEAYGREIIDCCHDLDSNLANYFDFEQFGQDALSGVSYDETDDGMILVMP